RKAGRKKRQGRFLISACSTQNGRCLIGCGFPVSSLSAIWCETSKRRCPSICQARLQEEQQKMTSSGLTGRSHPQFGQVSGRKPITWGSAVGCRFSTA